VRTSRSLRSCGVVSSWRRLRESALLTAVQVTDGR
jgi:hypothetical protein